VWRLGGRRGGGGRLRGLRGGALGGRELAVLRSGVQERILSPKI